MRVLVTGGAGFIGSHIVDALVDAGHAVRVLDALLPAVHRTKPSVNDAAEFITGDVTDQTAVDAALDGVDAVCHQAAMVGLGVDLDDLPVYTTHNDLGTAVLLAAMARRGIGRLVLASSMVVYGEGGYRCAADGPVRPGPRQPPDLDGGRFEPPCPCCGAPLRSTPVTEDAPLDPRSVYAATKVAQEHLAAAWAAATGGTVLALRYHNVYGPRMPRDTFYAGVASIFRSALERGEPPRVFEDGGQLRDFVHVHDVARANVAALRHSSMPGRLVPVNVGSGQAHTIGEMACVLSRAFGGPVPVVTGQYRAGDVRHIVASSDRARELLGYQAAVSFTEGITTFAHAPLRR
ncbi:MULTISPECIES: SDR family NAD(P)-dependent oxidoreductase [unclassified Pseudofrankia]|uniref:SDR family NAD(P)-dependent oxidoreductase n=1 Tax=unclassified Pseudofrankia TaxID=2994372 RepID=UPI0008DA93B6|nr:MULTISPECIES: SDR family NAD(P)-dependent oxidoreductase [unclassified Pseudofrankia]MDT3438037.1 SDR family NAD(P)-dependent oxidoreductase [Pseudofrankia sp. BMG5.37]OHV56767.1 NAD-dependent dehydratase [Pseudofrankia sp. BMG5.36]